MGGEDEIVGCAGVKVRISIGWLHITRGKPDIHGRG